MLKFLHAKFVGNALLNKDQDRLTEWLMDMYLNKQTVLLHFISTENAF
jgi:hypothetical protein